MANLLPATDSKHGHAVREGEIIYAAYVGVYIAVALVWLWKVDSVPLTRWDLLGGAVALTGMAIIVWGGWRSVP
jgi:drug/metabolite transporter superfamily protein YnfA